MRKRTQIEGLRWIRESLYQNDDGPETVYRTADWARIFDLKAAIWDWLERV